MTSIIEINNILITLAFLIIPTFGFVPVHKWLAEILKVSVSRYLLILVSPAILFTFVGLKLGVTGMILLVLAFFNTWAFLFSVSVDRKFVYALSLIFLALTPIFLLLKQEKIAEYFAILCYLSLVIGVTKDILYEKIFTK